MNLTNENLFTQDKTCVMAGPCAIESYEQLETTVQFLKTQGVSIVRGGIHKPRTHPKSFQGLKEKGVEIVKELKKKEDFIFITEVTSCRQIESLMEVADIFQVGTRNMYHYELLKELGQTHRPILLKRNFSAYIKDWILAGQYIENCGNKNVIFCERGIRTFETAYRNTFDINAISYLKHQTQHPIVADPSHGTGSAQMISDIALAAVVAGAHGLLIEVHPDPQKALSDKNQALNFEQFSKLMKKLKALEKFCLHEN